MKIESKRVFQVLGFEMEQTLDFEITINEIISKNSPLKDLEVVYSINESLDDVLDLKKGETLFFNITRDNKNDKGVVKRIK